MDRRSFVVAGFSIAGGLVAACALPTDVVQRDADVPVIHGTPFIMDVRVTQGAGAPRPTGTLIRGTRFDIRRSVTVTTGASGRRQTRTSRI
jgi:hypothetical protein